jgi:hypothetical protein
MKTHAQISFFLLFILLNVSCFLQAQQVEPNKEPNYTVNHESYFMPGIGYSYYAPKAQDSLGVFTGAMVEFNIYTEITQNERRGPSHTRFYGKLNLLSSNKKGVKDLFFYALGLDMSIEKNPKRDFGIPYFGIEMGGLSQSGQNTSLQFTPFLGIKAIAKPRIYFNIQGGYVYPVNNFDVLQGYVFQGSLNFSLW